MHSWPKIPPSLNTQRCGNFIERWEARQVIVLQQIGVQQRRLALAKEGDFHSTIKQLELHIGTLNARLNECREMIDSLRIGPPMNGHEINRLIAS